MFRKFTETFLSSREDFYSKLNIEGMIKSDYKFISSLFYFGKNYTIVIEIILFTMSK